MTTEALVWLDRPQTAHLVGKVHVTENRATVTSVFSYDPGYLAETTSYPIDPHLPLVSGSQVVRGGLPGALRDASPDRWGRNLIRKELLASFPGNASRHIGELDFLLGVSDETRQGALRLSNASGRPFLADSSVVPPLVELARLRRAAWSISLGEDSEGVRELLQAGTASLGGARPKAAVKDGERLLLAKFSHPQDDYDQVAAECVALDLAQRAGVDTPWHDLLTLDRDRALLVERFDRTPTGRVGYISAMTLTGFTDGDTLDYLLIADGIKNHGSEPAKDLQALWRRMLFFLGVSNLDDHGRNHGFVRDGRGWRLAPVFDITPDPTGASRATLMAGAGSVEECFQALPDIAALWNIPTSAQEAIARDVASALDSWPEATQNRKISGKALSELGAMIGDYSKRLKTTWRLV